MKIKIGTELIKITHNSLNTLWKSKGFYPNGAYLYIDNNWEGCSINFIKRELCYYIQIVLHLRHRTSPIPVYKEIRISQIKKNILECALNKNIYFNSFLMIPNKIKNYLSSLPGKVTMALAILIFLIDYFNNNIIAEFLIKNHLGASLGVFLAFLTLSSIIVSSSLRKEIDKEQVKKIAKEVFEKMEQDKQDYERVKRLSTL